MLPPVPWRCGCLFTLGLTLPLPPRLGLFPLHARTPEPGVTALRTEVCRRPVLLCHCPLRAGASPPLLTRLLCGAPCWSRAFPVGRREHLDSCPCLLRRSSRLAPMGALSPQRSSGQPSAPTGGHPPNTHEAPRFQQSPRTEDGSAAQAPRGHSPHLPQCPSWAPLSSAPTQRRRDGVWGSLHPHTPPCLFTQRSPSKTAQRNLRTDLPPRQSGGSGAQNRRKRTCPLPNLKFF